MTDSLGDSIYRLCCDLYPICRSITGSGVRHTLDIIKRNHLPDLTIHEIPSGTRCFDWVIPDEWNIRDAYIIGPDGYKIVDFQKSNLHVIGYSVPVDQIMTLADLQEHLYSLPDQPNAIPYVTSYYKRHWGFCLSHESRQRLREGDYRVVIDSELSPGHLTYGELIIPGSCTKEIFLSTYVCHPSLANNEVSGPAVTTFVAKQLLALASRRYTYRIIFIPETIGSIAYLSRHVETMKANMLAGFNVTCVGDDRAYSFLPSRQGNTLADQTALHVLRHLHPNFRKYSWLDRGSDERQYCSPGVDLPVASVMRSKYGEYPEYHTSLDSLDFISPSGLLGAYEVLYKCIECIEQNKRLKVTVLCEPQLAKRGLYPTQSTKDSGKLTRKMMNTISYCDGYHSLLDIAEKVEAPMWDLAPIVDQLMAAGLVVEVE